MRLSPSAHGLDGLDLGLEGLAVAAEADQAGDAVLGGDVDRLAQFGLDAVVVGALVQAVGQRVVPAHAGDGQAVLVAVSIDFLEILAARSRTRRPHSRSRRRP